MRSIEALMSSAIVALSNLATACGGGDANGSDTDGPSGAKHQAQLTNEGTSDVPFAAPSATPDGSSIFFQRDTGSDSDIYVIAATGASGSEKLVVAGGQHPTVGYSE